MRVSTYNIAGLNYGLASRAEDIVEALLGLDSTAVLLQECTTAFFDILGSDVGAELTRKMPYVVADPLFDQEWGVDSFCAIMSSVPFSPLPPLPPPPLPLAPVEAARLWPRKEEACACFSRFQWSEQDRGLLYALLDSDPPLLVGTAHLESPSRRDDHENANRMRQLRGCFTHLAASAAALGLGRGIDAVFGGDMNIFRAQEGEAEALAEELRWVECVTVDTFDGPRNATVSEHSSHLTSRPDRVFLHPQRLHATGASVHGTGLAPRLCRQRPLEWREEGATPCPSDHYCVALNLSAKQDNPGTSGSTRERSSSSSSRGSSSGCSSSGGGGGGGGSGGGDRSSTAVSPGPFGSFDGAVPSAQHHYTSPPSLLSPTGPTVKRNGVIPTQGGDLATPDSTSKGGASFFDIMDHAPPALPTRRKKRKPDDRGKYSAAAAPVGQEDAPQAPRQVRHRGEYRDGSESGDSWGDGSGESDGNNRSDSEAGGDLGSAAVGLVPGSGDVPAPSMSPPPLPRALGPQAQTIHDTSAAVAAAAAAAAASIMSLASHEAQSGPTKGGASWE